MPLPLQGLLKAHTPCFLQPEDMPTRKFSEAQQTSPSVLVRMCGLAYNVRWTVGSEAMFMGDKECW